MVEDCAARGIARFLGGVALGQCGYYGQPPLLTLLTINANSGPSSTLPVTTCKVLWGKTDPT